MRSVWLWLCVMSACAGRGKDSMGPADTDTLDTLDTPSTVDSAETDSEGTERSPLLAFDGAPPRNVLVISVDTLRRDRVGSHGGAESLTPFLDGLRGEGLVLEAHQSCSSWTFPSIVCALSGLDTNYNSYLSVQLGDPKIVAEDPGFLADALRDQGYGSAISTANAFLCDDYPPGGSYDTVDCRKFEDASVILALGQEHLDELSATGDPWLVHLHFMEPHSPYDAPEAYLGALEGLPPVGPDLSTVNGLTEAAEVFPGLPAEDKANLLLQLQIRYDAQVRYLDDQLAASWATWDAQGLLDDTLVVFWSDHGEQLLEHGVIGHGGSLYGVENDVMASFWAKNIQPAVWTERTSHTDLLPTILTGLGFPVSADLRGLPVGMRTDPPFALLCGGGGTVQQTVVRDDVRMVYVWDGTRALYRLDVDPDEDHSVYDPADPDVIELWEHLLPEVERAQAAYGGEPVAPGP